MSVSSLLSVGVNATAQQVAANNSSGKNPNGNSPLFTQYLNGKRQGVAPSSANEKASGNSSQLVSLGSANTPQNVQTRLDLLEKIQLTDSGFAHAIQRLEDFLKRSDENNIAARKAAAELLDHLKSQGNLSGEELVESLQALPAFSEADTKTQQDILGELSNILITAHFASQLEQFRGQTGRLGGFKLALEDITASQAAGDANALQQLHAVAYSDVNDAQAEASLGAPALEIDPLLTAEENTKLIEIALQAEAHQQASSHANVAQQAEENGALPVWLRDREALLPEQEALDEYDDYSDPLLPEVDLPEEAFAAEDEFAALSAQAASESAGAGTDEVTQEERALVRQAQLLQEQQRVSAVNAPGDADEDAADFAALKEPSFADKITDARAQNAQQPSDAESLAAQKKAFTEQFAQQTTGSSQGFQASQRAEFLAPLPKTAELKAAETTLQNVTATGQSSVVLASASEEIAFYDKQARTSEHLFLHRQEAVEQVQVAITRLKGLQADKITVQLEPIELGRVEVSLELAKDGSAQLNITAEKRETLQMLQRDARSLEQALKEAGIEADAGNMEFNLQQENHQAENGAGGFGDGRGASFEEHARASQRGASSDAQEKNTASIQEGEVITAAEYVVRHGLNVVA